MILVYVKQLSTIVKKFISKALEYKAVLNFKMSCMRCYTLLSDESMFM